jgi:hypothetical protein
MMQLQLPVCDSGSMGNALNRSADVMPVINRASALPADAA